MVYILPPNSILRPENALAAGDRTRRARYAFNRAGARRDSGEEPGPAEIERAVQAALDDTAGNSPSGPELTRTFDAAARKTATVNGTTVTWGGPDNVIEVSGPNGNTTIDGGSNFKGKINGIRFKDGQPKLPRGTVIRPA